MINRLLPAILIGSSLGLFVYQPGFPAALMFLGSLLFFALNSRNYQTISELEGRMDGLYLTAESGSEIIAELNTRTQALEKTVEILPSLKEAVIAVKNRGFTK